MSNENSFIRKGNKAPLAKGYAMKHSKQFRIKYLAKK